jgi:hypothetical protein
MDAEEEALAARQAKTERDRNIRYRDTAKSLNVKKKKGENTKAGCRRGSLDSHMVSRTVTVGLPRGTLERGANASTFRLIRCVFGTSLRRRPMFP